MKRYNYWRDSWPLIVRDCFDHGGRMFVIEDVHDDEGQLIGYRRRRELTRRQALHFRGPTVTLYGNWP